MVLKKLIAVVIGAAVGGAVAYLSRCSGASCNVCPLTSNPWLSVVWGAD